MIRGHLEGRGESLVPGDYDDTRAQFCLCETYLVM
jgi:hypothetical protein